MFAVVFEDNDEFAEMRTRHMQDHLAFLKENAEAIVAAGPLIDTENDAAAGGMWLVDADSADKVDQLVRSDPFWPTGLRKSVRILAWNQVFSRMP